MIPVYTSLPTDLQWLLFLRSKCLLWEWITLKNTSDLQDSCWKCPVFPEELQLFSGNEKTRHLSKWWLTSQHFPLTLWSPYMNTKLSQGFVHKPQSDDFSAPLLAFLKHIGRIACHGVLLTEQDAVWLFLFNPKAVPGFLSQTGWKHSLNKGAPRPALYCSGHPCCCQAGALPLAQLSLLLGK